MNSFLVAKGRLYNLRWNRNTQTLRPENCHIWQRKMLNEICDQLSEGITLLQCIIKEDNKRNKHYFMYVYTNCIVIAWSCLWTRSKMLKVRIPWHTHMIDIEIICNNIIWIKIRPNLWLLCKWFISTIVEWSV
jgi:hypothetical protein